MTTPRTQKLTLRDKQEKYGFNTMKTGDRRSMIYKVCVCKPRTVAMYKQWVEKAWVDWRTEHKAEEGAATPGVTPLDAISLRRRSTFQEKSEKLCRQGSGG